MDELLEDGWERHNVDKNMVSQDQALVSEELTLKARLASSMAIAQLLVAWPVSTRIP
jgi:TATA-binding protein-associated factor